MKDDLLKKLQAVKALADCGVGGEKENAQALLLRLMSKHDIAEADLDSEEQQLEHFRFTTKLEKRLLSQIIYMLMGNVACYCQRSNGNNHKLKTIGVMCNTSEKLEIITMYEFYNNAFKKELNLFYSAFISKNNIYPHPDKVKPDDSPSTLSEEEKLKISLMMDGIDRYTSRKKLGSEESKG